MKANTPERVEGNETPRGCRECGELKFHLPYCKINRHRCGSHSITMKTIRDSERSAPHDAEIYAVEPTFEDDIAEYGRRIDVADLPPQGEAITQPSEPPRCVCPDVVIKESGWEARYRSLQCPIHGESMAKDLGVERRLTPQIPAHLKLWLCSNCLTPRLYGTFKDCRACGSAEQVVAEFHRDETAQKYADEPWDCELVAHDTGDGWALAVENPADPERDVIAYLKWPDSFGESQTAAQLEAKGFIIV